MESIETLPKIELHLHLEGAVTPEETRELARRNQLASAAMPAEDFERRFQYSDFPGFLLAFRFVTEHLLHPWDYAWAARRLIDRLQAQTVIYAEIFLSAGVILKQKKPLDEIVEAICGASDDGTRGREIEVNWILDVTRQFGVPMAEEVVDAAIRLRAAGFFQIVGAGMGGDENSMEAKQFERPFRRARDAGLHVSIHAGEIGGPDSIWAALDILKAERIGHGLAARYDGRLLDTLAERNILLECALTSNLKTGAIRRIEEHPLKFFLDRGLSVNLNTDDPALFSTDLVNEYRLARAVLGCTRDDFVQMNRSALEHSFASPERRRSLAELFETKLRSAGI